MIITIDLIITIQKQLIEKTGGMLGIKDLNALESAINTVYQTFNQKDLYPTEIEKICRLSYNLNTSHPFFDGNKRIAMHVLILLLRFNNYIFTPSNEEVIEIGFRVAKNDMGYEQLLVWVKEQLKSK